MKLEKCAAENVVVASGSIKCYMSYHFAEKA